MPETTRDSGSEDKSFPIRLQRRKMPFLSDKRLIAESIAERLFTNGAGQKAMRLVLELPGKRDGGGWCKEALIDQIATALEAF